MKTLARLGFAILIPLLLLSCGGGAGGGKRVIEYSLTIQLSENPNGSIMILGRRVRAPADTVIILYSEAEEGFSLNTLKYYAGEEEVDLYENFIPDPYTDIESGVVSFRMPAADIIIEATYEHNARLISLSPNPPEGGKIETIPERTARYTEDVIVKVTPNPGFRLVKSLPGSPAVSYSYYNYGSKGGPLYAPYGFNMPDANVTVTANFEEIFTVTIINEEDKGTAMSSAEGGLLSKTFAWNERVDITTDVTDDWYAIGKITLEYKNIIEDITNTRFFNMPPQDVTVRVTYMLNPSNLYGIGIAKLTNGTIASRAAESGGASLPEAKAGMTVYLNVQPVAGYELTPGTLKYNDGSDHAITVPASGRPSFIMPAHEVTVSGEFRLKDIKVTGVGIIHESGAVGGGTVTPLRNSLEVSTARMGESVTVGIKPDNNYRFRTGTVTYSYQGSQGNPLSAPSYRFNMPAYDVTINARFERIYSITPVHAFTSPDIATGEAPGEITITNASGALDFAAGDTVNVDVTMKNNWYVVGEIRVNTTPGDITASGSFTMPSAPVTVTVTYKLNPANLYKITTPGAIEGGAIRARRDSSGSISLAEATAGTPVYLAITPDTGYRLLSVSAGTGVVIAMNGYTDTNTSARPSFSMPSRDVIVTGSFTKINYNLTAPAVTGGSIDRLGKTTAQYQENVTFTVTQNSGYRLRAGSVKYNGSDQNLVLTNVSGNTFTYSFPMPAAAVTLSAVFDQLYNVDVTNDGIKNKVSSKGIVSITDTKGAETASFISGEEVNVSVEITDDEYIVEEINRFNPASPSIKTSIVDGNFNMPSNNVTVEVTYGPNLLFEYSLTSSALNGTIRFYDAASGGNLISKAKADDRVYIAVTPDTGYKLVSLSTGSEISVDLNGYSISNPSARPWFEMPSPAHRVTVTATFTKIDYDLGVSALTGGSINLLGKTKAQYQDTVTFNVTPNTGFRLRQDSVKYNGSDQNLLLTNVAGSTFSYSFPMPAAAVTLSAVFDQLYNIDVYNDGIKNKVSSKGIVTITDSKGVETASFAEWDTVNVDVTLTSANNWYVVDKITVDASPYDITNDQFFTMPQGPVIVTVTYKLNPANLYKIAVPGAIEGGTIRARKDPTGSTSLSEATAGTDVYLAVSPDTGYQLKSGSLDAGSGTAINLNGYSNSNTSARPSFKMPASDVNVAGEFEKRTYTVSAATGIANGIITIAGTLVLYQNTATFTVKANNNYRLIEDSVKYIYNGGNYTPDFEELVDSTYKYSFPMPPANVTVTAEFERVYTVTLSADTEKDKADVVFINAKGEETDKFAVGEEVIVSITRKTFYMVDTIQADGVDITSTRSFYMPSKDVGVKVTYYLPSYDINTKITGTGTLGASVSGQTVFKAYEEDVVTLTIKPGLGYKYSSLAITSGTESITPQIITSTPDLVEATFSMPGNSVTVNCGFVLKTFTVQKEYPSVANGSISFISPSDPNGGTVTYGDIVTIKATANQGYRVNTMTYLMPGETEGIPVSSQGANYQFTVPDLPDQAYIHVHVDFVPAIFKISVASSVIDGTFVFWNKNDPEKTPVFSAPYLDTVVAELTLDSGYYYSGNFRVNGSAPAELVVIPGETQATVQFEFTMTPADASLSVQISKNKYTFTLNPLYQNGYASFSPASANHGDNIVIVMVPYEGYKAFQIKFNSPNAEKTYNIVNPSSNNNYTINLSDFTGVPTNNDLFEITVSFVSVNSYISYILNPDVGIRLTLQGNYIGNGAFVPTDSQIAVTLTNSTEYRYKPGSLKLNGVVPADLPPGIISYYYIKMPAGNVVVSVESEPIPSASISFDDPNMDSYIYFYGNLNEHPTDEAMFEIEGTASVGQTVELRVQKLAYVENDTNVYETIPNTAVRSWRLNENYVATNTNKFTVPPGSSGKTLVALVEIGGIPHSKSIKVK